MNTFISSYHEYLSNLSGNVWKEIILLGITLFLWLIFVLVFQVFLHEAGHCIFGLLAGFHILSFRLLSITIIKNKNNYRISKYRIPGSLGQCLLLPPQKPIYKLSLAFFILGGSIADLVISISTLLLMLSPRIISFPNRMKFFLMALYTFGSIVLNAIPGKENRINNDGTNLYYLLKDSQAVKCCLAQMSVLEKMQKGLSYKELYDDIFITSEDADLTNIFIAQHKILECYYYMDLRQWTAAFNCLYELETAAEKQEKLVNDKNKKYCCNSKHHQVIENIIGTEKLFLSIQMKKNSSEIEELFRKNSKLLYSRSSDFNLLKVRMAYDLFKDNSSENKDRIRRRIKKRIQNYPYIGEASFCAGMVGEVLNLG
jgi:hypothetical protein